MAVTVEKTSLDEVLLLTPSMFRDHRGTYVETYNIDDYLINGIDVRFVRDDISTSAKNVLRGIHYDEKTWKLIQCMFGRIFLLLQI